MNHWLPVSSLWGVGQWREPFSGATFQNDSKPTEVNWGGVFLPKDYTPPSTTDAPFPLTPLGPTVPTAPLALAQPEPARGHELEVSFKSHRSSWPATHPQPSICCFRWPDRHSVLSIPMSPARWRASSVLLLVPASPDRPHVHSCFKLEVTVAQKV